MRLPVALQVCRVRLLRAGKQRTHISAACCATWRRGRRTPSNCGLPCATTVRLSPDKPRFGRFNYAGKSEYWALVWGTALMGLASVTIWAKVWVGNLPARWWIDVASLLRAILATLAILVWHFYQVFFDPDVYPMNWVWWDDKMPVDHYDHEHSLDKESLPGKESAPGEDWYRHFSIS